MLIIKETDVQNESSSFNEDDFEYAHAQELINNWGIVKDTLDSPGWRYLNNYFYKLLKRYDSVRNCTEKDFAYRQGLCDGISKLIEAPKRLQQLSASAQKKLAEAAKQENEDG